MKNGFQAYANSFQTVSRLGLERISELLAELGNPESKVLCLHIAGTNGKGSVAAYLSAILTEAGYRTGLYTSPNLVSVTERIQISGERISQSDLSELLARVEAACDRMQARGSETPTQFEIWTAAAFLYFSEKKVDYVVLETGLGGEYDATNVISRNVLSILTKIDLDHTQYLGNTLAEIAHTKSKIIKARCESGVTVISAQDNGSIPVVQEEATAMGTKLIVAGKATIEGTEEIYEVISYDGMKGLRLGLGGIYQIENACTAIECAKALGLSEDAIREGLMAAKNPARFEMIGKDPTVIYDGGHNPNGVRSLKASLDRYYPETPRTVVFACMADKEFAPSLAMLNDGYSKFVFTTVQNNPRAMGAEALRDAAAEKGIAGEWAHDLKSAIALAREKGDLVVVCGSLYLYADLF